MRKIKVFLQYPLKVSDSQYYRSMIDNPPRGIEYIGKTNNVGMISSGKKFFLFGFLKRQLRYWMNQFGMIVPNARLSKDVENCDIIYCAHCLSKNKNKPWILDVESLWQLWISGYKRKEGREKVLEYLKKDNCKKIITWTEGTKRDIIKKFPEIKDKVEVIYYAMERPKLEPKAALEDLILFFSGRHFYAKGGLHATEAIDRLTKKYSNVRGVINGNIPIEIIKKYSDNKKLKFYQLMPYGKILKLYRDSDIFVYPGYSDSFGFVFMDAMAFGVPIITVDGFARREIIKDGKTGFVLGRPAKIDNHGINEDVIGGLVKKTEILIRDKKLRENMGKNCVKEIENGNFSIKIRNGKLKYIYEEIMNES